MNELVSRTVEIVPYGLVGAVSDVERRPGCLVAFAHVLGHGGRALETLVSALGSEV